MAIRRELILRLQNSPGVLGQVCQHLLNERVNILALNLESGGTLRLIVDNPLHAAETLKDQQFSVNERDVLFIQLPNNPGALEQATQLLTKVGINIEYVYGSAFEDYPMASIIVGVEDVQRAAMAAGI